MHLEDEIKSARTEIVSDGYDMSVGEVINLYRDDEIMINPEFQRLFRWDASRKSTFIESLLLGIPIPPIFVYQDEEGVWELIDGLQRLSTILEFVGILKNPEGGYFEHSVMEGTKYLPSMSGKVWEEIEGCDNESIGKVLQLSIKRARLRVEILKKESDANAKYELFQRLNTGGMSLSNQEVRNCVAIMLNKPLYDWMQKLSHKEHFMNVIAQSPSALEKQSATELVLRFLAVRLVKFDGKLDVNPYLDHALLVLARDESLDYDELEENFDETFSLLNRAMGTDSFKRWDGSSFKGKFLMSVFEVVATGVSKNLDAINNKRDPEGYLQSRCQDLWENRVFKEKSGAGINGKTRLLNLLPLANSYFAE